MKKKKLFKGKSFDVSIYNFNISGKKIQHEIIEQNSAAAILAIEKNKIIMIRQFRYPHKQVLEIPAGIRKKNETSLKEYQDKIDYKVNLENLIDEIELIMTKVGISKTDSLKFIESLKVEKQIMKEQKSKMIEKDVYDLVKEYRATRVTDDYYSYYNKISDDTLKSVNEYYNGDFDYLGMKRL